MTLYQNIPVTKQGKFMAMNCQVKICGIQEFYFSDGKTPFFNKYLLIFRSKVGKIWKYGLNPDDCKHTKRQIQRMIRDYMAVCEIGAYYEEISN